MSRKLYLVPTPIGNLKDITYRSVEVLQSVDLILAEDTRVTKKLLDHYQIDSPMSAYHEFNKDEQLPTILNQLKNQDLALVSDAGSPGISDPGYELVRACIDKNITVIPLPGASALIPALTGSGLATDSFAFLGFLGKKSSARRKRIAEWSTTGSTLIVYESPYRLAETLIDIEAVLGDRQACIAREISKRFETYYRAKLRQLIKLAQADHLAGEIVIVVAGADRANLVWDENQVLEALQHETQAGTGLNQAAKTIAQLSGWKKSQIYQLGLAQKNK